jgi:ribosomal protein S3
MGLQLVRRKRFCRQLQEDLKVRVYLTASRRGSRILIDRTPKRADITIHVGPGLSSTGAARKSPSWKKSQTDYQQRSENLIQEIKRPNWTPILWLRTSHSSWKEEWRSGRVKMGITSAIRMVPKGARDVRRDLGGAEIARSEQYRKDASPAHARADIDCAGGRNDDLRNDQRESMDLRGGSPTQQPK